MRASIEGASAPWLDDCGTMPVDPHERETHPPPAPVAEPTCSGCGYCEPVRDLHCHKCCDLGFPF